MRTYYNFLSFLYGNEFVLQLLLISFVLLPWKRRRKYFPAIFPATFALVFACSALFAIPVPFHYLVIFTLFFGAVFASFKISFLECLFYTVNAYCVQHIVSTASYALIWLIMKACNFDFTVYGIIHPIISILFLALAAVGSYYLCARNWNKFAKLKFNHFIITYAALVFLALAVFLSHYMQEAVDGDKVVYFFVKIFSLLNGTATLIINVLNVHSTNLKEEQLILQILLKKDKEYYERARLNAEKINIKFHDLKHKAADRLSDEERTEINQLSGDFVTGNRALDIIITEKQVKCEKYSVKLVCSVEGGLLEFMKPYHVYSLFGNALDNAIESLVKVADVEKREIRLTVCRFRDMCKILVSNYFSGSLEFENGLPKTTKNNKSDHGYGIKSIREVAQTYGGEMSVSVIDDSFNMLIMLPLPKDAEEN